MPVIRGQAQAPAVTAEHRKKVADQLARELKGEETPGRPVIFEIPLEQQNRIDVLVVWDGWKPFNSTERSEIILEIYKKSKAKVAQALGVTHREAIEQQVLPYAVVPMTRGDGGLNEQSLRQAMLKQGGLELENGKADLRFPTMALAENAHKQLTDELPKGYWSIVQTAGYVQ